jgi:hypothetical protein
LAFEQREGQCRSPSKPAASSAAVPRARAHRHYGRRGKAHR